MPAMPFSLGRSERDHTMNAYALGGRAFHAVDAMHAVEQARDGGLLDDCASVNMAAMHYIEQGKLPPLSVN